MTTIELGELGSPGAGPDVDRRRRPDRRLIRRWGVAGATVLCLLAVTGSVRPQPRGIRPLWSVPMGQNMGTTLTADTVYLHQIVAGEPRLSAYDLATGDLRWSRHVDDPAGYLQTAVSGLLLLPTDRRTVPPAPGDQSSWATDFAQSTTALDPATGRTLWTVPGDVETLDVDTALMSDHADDGRLRRLRLLRLSDQRTIWSRDVPGVRNRTVAVSGGRPDKIITTTDRGEITVFRYADGAHVASARIPWIPPDPQTGTFTDVVAAGDVLVVNRTRPDVDDLRVYRLDTLTLVWTLRTAGDYPFGCGPAICLHDRSGVTSFEPLTGRVRWRLATADHAWPVTPDRLILEASNGDGWSVFVDAATGALVGEPGTGLSVWNGAPGAYVLVLSPTASPPGRTSVTRWDLATGRRNLLGAIPALTEHNCQAVTGYLTCVRNDLLEVTAVG